MAFVFLIVVFFIDHYCRGYLISIAYCSFFSLVHETAEMDIKKAYVLTGILIFEEQHQWLKVCSFIQTISLHFKILYLV